jgi:hypothetical protein
MSRIRVGEQPFGAGLPLMICICVLLSGCSKDVVKVPPLHPVTGRVTYQGKPVPGATVTFIADAKPAEAKSKSKDEPQWPARCVGEADDDGNYTLAWDESHVGAPEGTYKVMITATEPFQEGDDTDERRPNAIPDRFGNPKTSGLTAKVEPGENVFDFELTDAAAAPSSPPGSPPVRRNRE